MPQPTTAPDNSVASAARTAPKEAGTPQTRVDIGRRLVDYLAEKAKPHNVDTSDIGPQLAFRFCTKRLGSAPTLFPEGPRALGKTWTVQDIPPVDLLIFMKLWIKENIPADRMNAVMEDVTRWSIEQVTNDESLWEEPREPRDRGTPLPPVRTPLQPVRTPLQPVRTPLLPRSANMPAAPLFQPISAKGKRARDDDENPSSVKKSRTSTTTGPGTPATGKTSSIDIGTITLPGEASDAVPVYDTCADVRKKISLHLTKSGMTQAQFLRDLMAQYHVEEKRIQASQLARFREAKGATMGNTNPVYYAAYVYFEKIRIREGKRKSAKREEMETVWPNGMDVTHRNTGRYWCSSDKRPSEDQYGRLSFV